jgi:two-component system phosphate regulon response regulator PhoB
MAVRRRTRHPRCVIVEDDPFAADLLCEQLDLAGFDVTAIGDGRAGLDAILADPPAICVLDINLPGLDGISILQELRSKRIAVGTIMLTAQATDLDRVRGLRLGADDYLGKPFLPAELVARAEALLRRLGSTMPDNVRAGDLDLDLGARSVVWRGTPVELTKTEFDLMAELANAPGKVLSRAQLLTRVWELPAEWTADATLTEHVHRLRNKLDGISIRALRGVGYRFDP